MSNLILFYRDYRERNDKGIMKVDELQLSSREITNKSAFAKHATKPPKAKMVNS